jgi:hypothetical protein
VGTIAVSIEGKPKFTWHGDEAKIAEIMETYPEGAARQDMTPKELAVICIDHLVNNVAAHDDLAREAQQIGLIWLILNAESNVRGHRGKISFYAADTDFEVDLHVKGRTVTIEVNGPSKFDT